MSRTPRNRFLTAAVASVALVTGAGQPRATQNTIVVRDAARPLPLTAIRLTGGPLKRAQELDAKYLIDLEPDRMLATVLFARTIGPAADTAVPSDARWNELLDRYYAQVRKEVEWFRGRDIEMASDGFLATFDGPARAIRTACAIREAAVRLGIETKTGVHTGECDITNHRVTGTAVDIGAQVVEKAAPGEVLVSRTVKDLVAGSGIAFEDRGEHILEGVAGEWRLFSVARGGCN